ncbi:serine hydrolase domain-containing protein [Mesorhizobium sp. LHD-90]|uniref:serine hydrolase domain-containing protein n=1 Tax=Mesorhizobium sp. LHD-90 TaxID=3071414 RepID=UPI0027DF1B73|nr:serine hydrolase domain-containing protein [Mesorhizobium sp. LHD-90]MDQ6433022.1 serine hydrolase domain-containing protein [Mesorhizobium sp. LHD-90]
MGFHRFFGAGRFVLARRGALRVLATLIVWTLGATQGARADEAMEIRIRDLAIRLDAYVTKGMKDFDSPGAAIGIVTSDRLYFLKGYGVRRKGGEPVDTKTVFQIGSTTKAFLATTMAIAADRGNLDWDARVADLDPDFQMKDPWVTSAFRVSDLLAQRSGMPPSANDVMGILGVDQAGMVRAMRFVEPVSSFRSTFAYTNVTHMLAQRIVARQFSAPDWDSVVRKEIFGPLGMQNSSFTAEAIQAAPNHTEGYRWTPQGSVEVPFTPIFPYGFGAAGAINSTIEDLGPWVRLHLANGKFEGKEIVSAKNLGVTKTPRTGMSDRLAYAMGWVIQSTPNGRLVWHNGGTTAYGAFIGMAPDKDVGVIVLTNETNVGLPDAIGEWTLDRLLGNPEVDHVAERLKAAKAAFAQDEKAGAAPATRQAATVLPPLVGDYVNDSFGQVTVSEAEAGLLVELKETGAKLKLDDLGGQAFSVTLVPEGRFAAIAENLGPTSIGVAQFEVGLDGGISGFRFASADNGQPYPFKRR